MAALWAEAALIFSPAGFGPVLAQAVGTPSITVYGGRESFKTTQRAGAHLAPTLGIDPIRPCDCHSHRHACRKSIDEPRALQKIEAFVNENVVMRGQANACEEAGYQKTGAIVSERQSRHQTARAHLRHNIR